MSRPTKPNFTPPTAGTGFGRAASQALLDLPNAMQFLDDSNAYQLSVFDAPNDAVVVQGDKAAQGISAATARRPLFVNAAGDGLTTELPEKAGIVTANLRVSKILAPSAPRDFPVVSDRLTSTSTNSPVITRVALGGAVVVGHSLGHRFVELMAQTSAFNAVRSVGTRYAELTTNLPTVLDMAFTLPEAGAALVTQPRTTGSTPGEWPREPSFSISLDTERVIYFTPVNGVWQVSCKALDSPEAIIPLRRRVTSGIFRIRIESQLLDTPGSTFRFDISVVWGGRFHGSL